METAQGNFPKATTSCIKPWVAGLGSALLFSIMGFLVHTQKGQSSPALLMFTRALAGVIFLTPFCTTRLSDAFRVGSFWIWARSFAGAVSVLCGFWVFQQGRAGDARALSYLESVFIAILSWIFLKETLSFKEITGILILVGSALSLGLPTGASVSPTVMGVAALGSCFATLAFVSLRQASQKYSRALVVWCFSLGCAFVSVPFLKADDASAALAAWGVITSIAVLGLIGQLLLTQSFSGLPAGIASAIRVSGLLFTVALELLFHNHHFSKLAFLSYAGVTVGVIMLSRKSSR